MEKEITKEKEFWKEKKKEKKEKVDLSMKTNNKHGIVTLYLKKRKLQLKNLIQI